MKVVNEPLEAEVGTVIGLLHPAQVSELQTMPCQEFTALPTSRQHPPRTSAQQRRSAAWQGKQHWNSPALVLCALASLLLRASRL
eukprot:6342597-Amphidinium_carterae.1